LNQLRFGINRRLRSLITPERSTFRRRCPDSTEKFARTISGVVTEMGGDYRLPRFDRLNNISLNNTAFITRGRQEFGLL
jgi:hypothetical protein